MNHRQIEESNVVAAYVAGSLPPEEEARFEEHLLECAACRKQVEAEEVLRLGFQAFAEEEGDPAATAPASPSRPAPVAAPALPFERSPGAILSGTLRAPRGPSERSRRRWLSPALAAAALLALAAPLAWLIAERGELREELARLRAAPQPAPAAPGGGEPAPVAAAESASEKTRLEAELRQAREAGERLALELAEALRARGNAPIFTLGFVRGAEAEANRVELGPRPEWIVLVVELPAQGARAFDATLVGADGKARWRVAGLRPRGDDTVSIGLWSALLLPGKYRLRLVGNGDGTGAPSSFEIPLQVVAAPTTTPSR